MILPPPPPLWIPEKPAIIRPAPLDLIGGGQYADPVQRAMAVAALGNRKRLTTVAVAPTFIGRSARADSATAIPVHASTVAGDLLIGIMWSSGSSSKTATGWTFLTTGSQFVHFFYRNAVGATGNGSISAAVQAMCSFTIRGHTAAPVLGTEATTTGANPDPPSLTSGFGAVPTLWMATAIVASHVATGLSAYPSGYSSGSSDPYSDGTGMCAVAFKAATAASEDAGTFTKTGSANCGARTLAIH